MIEKQRDMEDFLVWLFWAVIIGGSIASSASKAKKQREEEARKAAAAKAEKARAAAAKTAHTTVRPVSTTMRPAQTTVRPAQTTVRPAPDVAKPVAGGSFGRVLEELSRQLSEQPSPTVVVGPKTFSWPVSQPASQPASQPVSQPAMTSQPAATSYDYRSLEQEYTAMDGREYRGDWSAELVEDEVTVYERLAEQRAGRSSLTAAAIPGAGAGAGAGANQAVATQDMSADRVDDDRPTLYELLGGDFDLRRAVIEAEILTPKYAAGY